MATFSTNSVRQLYVVNAVDSNAVASEATVGTYVAATPADLDGAIKFKYINGNGQLVTTDSIKKANIRSIVTSAAKMKVLRQDVISAPTITTGQTYTLRILFRNWGSGSSENQYFKHVGSYKATAGATAETLFTAIKTNAVKNFKSEAIPMLNFEVAGTGAEAVLIITEVDQPWVLGKNQGRNLNYEIQLVPIYSSTDPTLENASWATITKNSVGRLGVGTGKLVSDMEYFYLGERGDVYRQVGFPYTWEPKYLADKTAYYHIIDISYYHEEPGLGGGTKYEKQMTFVTKDAITTKSVFTALRSAINTATGITMADITTASAVIKAGGLGTAGSGTFTGLITSKKYKVVDNNTGLVYPSKADGTLGAVGDAPVALSTVTAITGLTNGKSYTVLLAE